MIRLVEVGPRDGLQNEPGAVPLGVKIELIERLAAAGLPAVEAGSFVNPKLVPQMADSGEIYTKLRRRAGTAYPALVANMRGLEAALAVGVAEIAVFISASEGFSQRNIACSVAESFIRVGPVVKTALAAGIPVRGYVSCVIACPFDGPTPPARAAEVAARLAGLGCYEISLGDTIGIGTAAGVRRLIAAATPLIPLRRIAMHFHDTYGQGVANILASLEAGITVFDSSVAGLGGCPFAPGATGNVATEDVLHLLHGMGLETGIDLPAVAATGAWIASTIGRPNNARAGRALTTKT